MFLLITLAIQNSTAQTKNDLNKSSTQELTQSSKTFSESEVLELVAQLKAEAEIAIDNAYNEGYKAGMLEYAPTLEGLRLEKEWLTSEVEKYKRKRWQVPVLTICGVGVGLFAGFMVGGNK